MRKECDYVKQEVEEIKNDYKDYDGRNEDNDEYDDEQNAMDRGSQQSE